MFYHPLRVLPYTGYANGRKGRRIGKPLLMTFSPDVIDTYISRPIAQAIYQDGLEKEELESLIIENTGDSTNTGSINKKDVEIKSMNNGKNPVRDSVFKNLFKQFTSISPKKEDVNAVASSNAENSSSKNIKVSSMFSSLVKLNQIREDRAGSQDEVIKLEIRQDSCGGTEFMKLYSSEKVSKDPAKDGHKHNEDEKNFHVCQKSSVEQFLKQPEPEPPKTTVCPTSPIAFYNTQNTINSYSIGSDTSEKCTKEAKALAQVQIEKNSENKDNGILAHNEVELGNLPIRKRVVAPTLSSANRFSESIQAKKQSSKFHLPLKRKLSFNGEPNIVADNILKHKTSTMKMTGTKNLAERVSLFSTGNGKQLMIDSEQIDKAKARLEGSIDGSASIRKNSKVGVNKAPSLFCTGKGQQISIDVTKIKKAKKLLQVPLEPLETKDINQAVHKKYSLPVMTESSTSSLHVNSKLAGLPTQKQILSLFSTGSGKQLKLSEKKIQEAKLNCSLADNQGVMPKENKYTTPSLFSKGNGKAILLSTESLQKAHETLTEPNPTTTSNSSNYNQNNSIAVNREAPKKASNSFYISDKQKNATVVTTPQSKISLQGNISKSVSLMGNNDLLNLLQDTISGESFQQAFLDTDSSNLSSIDLKKYLEAPIDVWNFVQDEVLNLAVPSLVNNLTIISFSQVLEAMNELNIPEKRRLNFQYLTHHAKLIKQELLSSLLSKPGPNIPFNGLTLVRRLLGRFQNEFVQRKSTVIRKVLDHCFNINSLFVLKVYIVIDSEWLILSDGYYLFPARVMGNLKTLFEVNSELFKQGRKIGLCGCSIANLSPDHDLDPLDLAEQLVGSGDVNTKESLREKPHIILQQNTTKPIPTNTPIKVKLGEQQKPYFSKLISQVEPEGGPVPCIEGWVSKIIGISYCEVQETENGKRYVFLTPAEEKIIAVEQERKEEQRRYDAIKEFEKTKSIQSPEYFIPEPVEMRRQLLRFRICDISNQEVEITMWNPTQDFLFRMIEGKHIKALFLSPGKVYDGILTMKTTKSSFFFFSQKPKHSLKENSSNEITTLWLGRNMKHDINNLEPGMICNVIGHLVSVQSSSYDNSCMLFLEAAAELSIPKTVISCKWQFSMTHRPAMVAALGKHIGKPFAFLNISFNGRDPFTHFLMFAKLKNSSFSLGKIEFPLSSTSRSVNKIISELAKGQRRRFSQGSIQKYSKSLDGILRHGFNAELDEKKKGKDINSLQDNQSDSENVMFLSNKQ